MKARFFATRGLLFGGAILLTAFVGIVFAPAASAHNQLNGSTPAAGSVVAAAPQRMELTFAQDIDAEFASVAMTAEDTDVKVKLAVQGRNVNVIIGDLPAELARPTEPKAWKLGYRMISKDGHPVSGLIEFTVDPEAVAASAALPSSNDDSVTAVAAPPAAAADATGNGVWMWATVGMIALAAIAAIGLVLRNRRRTPVPVGGPRSAPNRRSPGGSRR